MRERKASEQVMVGRRRRDRMTKGKEETRCLEEEEPGKK